MSHPPDAIAHCCQYLYQTYLRADESIRYFPSLSPSLLFPFFLRDSITIGIILIRESASSAIFTARSPRLELRSSILLISPMKIILSLRESIRPLSFVVLLYTVIPTMLTVACLHAIRDVTSQCWFNTIFRVIVVIVLCVNQKLTQSTIIMINQVYRPRNLIANRCNNNPPPGKFEPRKISNRVRF